MALVGQGAEEIVKHTGVFLYVHDEDIPNTKYDERPFEFPLNYRSWFFKAGEPFEVPLLNEQYTRGIIDQKGRGYVKYQDETIPVEHFVNAALQRYGNRGLIRLEGSTPTEFEIQKSHRAWRNYWEAVVMRYNQDIQDPNKTVLPEPRIFDVAKRLGKPVLAAPAEVEFEPCPYCGEGVPQTAVRCKSCQGWLIDPDSKQGKAIIKRIQQQRMAAQIGTTPPESAPEPDYGVEQAFAASAPLPAEPDASSSEPEPEPQTAAAPEVNRADTPTNAYDVDWDQLIAGA